MENLRRVTADAVRAINSSGELPLRVRNRLKQSLRQLLGDEVDFRLVWGELQVRCARYSQWIWKGAFPRDADPIEFAERCLASALEKETQPSLQDLARLRTNLENKLLMGGEHFPAVYAGFAGWAAARDILGGPGDVREADSEVSVDPQDWDACFFASIAVAGGATWEEVAADSNRRRAFWQWYLNDAFLESLMSLDKRQE